MKTSNVNVTIQLDTQNGSVEEIQTALDFINATLQRDSDSNYSAQIFVNDISSSDITETGEDTDVKTELIENIQRIINLVGDVQMTDDVIASESSITINKTGNTKEDIYAFGYDGCDTAIYVDNIETADNSHDYEDLTIDVLTEINHLLKMVEADFLKTEKRI